MRCVVGFCPAFSRHGPALVGVLPREPLDIVFRNHHHRVPHLGADMRRVLSSLEEEDSFVPSGPPARPYIG